MTPEGPEPSVEQLREDLDLLRDELAQLGGQLARLNTRTETHGHALDDIESYVTETAQLARAAAEHASPAAGTQAEGVKTTEGVDMGTLVPWVENNTTSPPSSRARFPPPTGHPAGVRSGGTTPRPSPASRPPAKPGSR